MKRIIMHWTAGKHEATPLDMEHYHYLVEGGGIIIPGLFDPEANEHPKPGEYAAHTLNCNSGSIGVAVCGMFRAVQRPFFLGIAPLTVRQVNVFVDLVARLARQYSITIARDTVLTHAEVQPTLGIRQRGKWDITWLPGMEKPGDPVAVGDQLRRMIINA